MSFEGVDGPESIKSKNIKALESLKDDRLSEEAILLRDAILALGDEKAAAVIGEGQPKVDLLFLKAARYDVQPKSLLFMNETIDPAAVVRIREKLRDFSYLKGRTKEIMLKEEELAGEIAEMLAELVQAEYREAA